jgi:hypothetical protein
MTVTPPGLIRMVRDRLHASQVSVGSHVLAHGRDESFTLRQVRATVLYGQVIDWMPDRRRLLFCARVRNDGGRLIWLHVVVDYLHPTLAGLVTAYVPDQTEWEEPPLRRRR